MDPTKAYNQSHGVRLENNWTKSNGKKRMDTTQYAKYLFQVSMLQKVAIKKSNDWKQEKFRFAYSKKVIYCIWGGEEITGR